MGTKTGAKRRKKGPKGPFSRPAERSCGSSPAKYRNNNLRHTANEYGLCLFLSPLARINEYKIMKYNQL